MTQKIYQVDAFADRLFKGNPAAVCPLKEWLPTTIMQAIAMENNLAETAFYTPTDQADTFNLRWFTPTIEVDLCGHATLATAHVIYQFMNYSLPKIIFKTKSGDLIVQKIDLHKYAMEFPTDTIEAISVPENIPTIVDAVPVAMYRGKDDLMVVVENQSIIEHLKPNFHLIAQLPARGLIVTAPGNTTDFVSRCFFPQSGINEDPVTGSAHTTMTPYWSKALGKTTLTACQLSKRSGTLLLNHKGERTEIIGKAMTYLIGNIRF